MKKIATSLVFGASVMLSSAATINYAGFAEDTTVNDWRTAATAKSLDLDGDNIYGTLGAVHWTVLGANEFPANSPNPGWSYGGENTAGQFKVAGYAVIDNLAAPLTDTEAGIGAVQSPGSFTFSMTGIAETYAGKVLRIGVMADVLTAAEWAADTGKTFQITGAGGDSGVISLRGGGAGDGQPEMYFFDISGVNPGDSFTIATGSASAQPGYLGPVSWDLYAVPEPSTALLAGALLLPFARRRRQQASALVS